MPIHRIFSLFANGILLRLIRTHNLLHNCVRIYLKKLVDEYWQLAASLLAPFIPNIYKQYITMSWKASLSRHLSVIRFFADPKSPASRGIM